jgi:signal transduction histidine kinase
VNETGPLMAENKVTCTLALAEETGGILGNTGKLSLVLRNIIVNALEAMANRGGVVRITSALSGEFLVISIGDSGGGIKKEHEELIFEPFFSTKTEVEGAGLGLSVAYGTMKSLGGTITFVSEEGKGTVFEIHFPLG